MYRINHIAWLALFELETKAQDVEIQYSISKNRREFDADTVFPASVVVP